MKYKYWEFIYEYINVFPDKSINTITCRRGMYKIA